MILENTHTSFDSRATTNAKDKTIANGETDSIKKYISGGKTW